MKLPLSPSVQAVLVLALLTQTFYTYTIFLSKSISLRYNLSIEEVWKV